MKSIIIHSFMLRDLKLRGVELVYFALIYSFSQLNQPYFASDITTCTFLNISRAQLFRVRDRLFKKGFIYSVGKGLFVSGFTQSLNKTEEELQELIRIAKTPWLDD